MNTFIKGMVCTWLSAVSILFLTGLILPSLISTDHMPLWAIILITLGIFCVVPLVIFGLLDFFNRKGKKNGRVRRVNKRRHHE